MDGRPVDTGVVTANQAGVGRDFLRAWVYENEMASGHDELLRWTRQIFGERQRVGTGLHVGIIFRANEQYRDFDGCETRHVEHRRKRIEQHERPYGVGIGRRHNNRAMFLSNEGDEPSLTFLVPRPCLCCSGGR
ncbi:MAG: hypothetical protein CL472_05880 [Acidobacteria bacterium]|nr:hypothetical protein [Acidobacteriota bacterium]